MDTLYTYTYIYIYILINRENAPKLYENTCREIFQTLLEDISDIFYSKFEDSRFIAQLKANLISVFYQG